MKQTKFILLILTLSLSSCMLSYETIEIDHYREPVSLWDGPWMSYRIRASNDEVLNWVWGIKGFQDYRWGNKYKIKVKKKIILNPPLDAPSSEYSFIKVISKEKAGSETRFVLSLKEGRDVYFTKEEGRFRLLDEIDFTFHKPVVQENLEAFIPFSRSIKGNFSHLNDTSLLLHNIEYVFDRNLAIEYLLSLTDPLIPEQVEEWNEIELVDYIVNINIEER